jgi:spore coat polysaccharide biosynthesis protein SpsF
VNIVAIIQARMRSTRLPAKVVADLAGRPILERVVRRTSRATRVNAVCIATTEGPEDDKLADLGAQLGVQVFRGSENDVLSRYVGAAEAARADVCVRITADCPLIDPDVIDRVISAFLDEPGEPDYASNRLRQTFPRGLDTEVFSLAALKVADREATASFERAHVTVFLYRHPERFHILGIEHTEDLSVWRWTVDESDDLRFVREVYAALGPDDAFGLPEIRDLLLQRPELPLINMHVRQKEIAEG